MKDFLNNLDSSDTFALIIATLLVLLAISICLIINITTSIDLYLLRDNAQAVALYLTKGN